MAKPKSVTILGEEYTVEYVPDLRTDDNRSMWGLCKYSESRILINSDVPLPKQKEVLLHEMIHAVYDRMQTFDKPKQEEERVVDNTAIGLMCIFRENKKLAEWLIEQ